LDDCYNTLSAGRADPRLLSGNRVAVIMSIPVPTSISLQKIIVKGPIIEATDVDGEPSSLLVYI
jgi:hypothetical protein